MNESQAGKQAVSMVVKLYLGILTGIPERFHAFQDYKTMNYHRELVEQEIVWSGNAVAIAADDRAMEFVRVKLQEKGICFSMAESEHEVLREKVKANGRFLFFCREIDYERILEAVHEVEREISLKDQKIEEEELERGREEPEKEEETKREGSEEEFQAEDEEPEEFREEAEQRESRKKKRKKKKGRYSDKQQEPMKPSKEAVDRELTERNRKETPASEPYRMQESTQYSEREEPYCKRRDEYSKPGSDKRDGYSGMQEAAFMDNQAGTVNHHPASGHTAQKDGLANADRNRVTDFHDRTRTEGESREETIQSSQFVLSPSREGGHAEPARHTHQKGKSRYPDDTSAPDGRENGSREKGERPSARSVVTDSPSYARKERSDRTKQHTGDRQTVSADQTVFLGNSSSLPDSTYSSRHFRCGCLNCGNGMSIPSNRMMGKMDKKWFPPNLV